MNNIIDLSTVVRRHLSASDRTTRSKSNRKTVRFWPALNSKGTQTKIRMAKRVGFEPTVRQIFKWHVKFEAASTA
jgi:hypothetical protein